MMKKVSIVIPVYNIEKYIDNCINSLVQQTYNNIELIFVDDVSPDKSIEIIQHKLKNQNFDTSKYKIIRNDANQGLSGARLSGIKASTGDYIFHLDGDDWISKDTIEKLIKTADKNNSDFVLSNMSFEFPSHNLIRHIPNFKTKEEYIKNILQRNVHYPWNLVNILMSKSLADQVLPTQGINMGEDWITMPKLMWKAKKISVNNSITYFYRQDNPSSYTNSISIKSYEDLINGSKILFSYFLQENPIIFNPEYLEYCKMKLKTGILMIGNHDIRKIVIKDLPANKKFKGLSINDHILLFLSKLKLWYILDTYVKTGLRIKKVIKSKRKDY